MSYMSMRELNANVSKALAQAETGEDLILTRNGKPVLRVTKDGVPVDSDKREAAIAELIALMERGVDLGGRATYDERTGR